MVDYYLKKKKEFITTYVSVYKSRNHLAVSTYIRKLSVTKSYFAW